MKVEAFDFELPEELIAQTAVARGASRLLVLDRSTSAVSHASIRDLPRWLRAGDLLVANDTRVFPARLIGRRVPSGGAVECLLLQAEGEASADRAEVWQALMHPGQKLKPGARVVFEGAGARLHGEVLERLFFGRRRIRLTPERGRVADAIDALGHVPLPPYIHRDDTAADRERYQTVFAAHRGSVAAPTAGLHFDASLLEALSSAGVERATITLHVGYGTFKPVRVDEVQDHVVDPEPYDIGEAAARAIDAALDERRRVIAVGTTTTRALEHAARRGGGRPAAGRGEADVFIYPGFEFRVISGLLTNFHLPKSSLLMLVSAFAGRERVLEAYRQAVAQRYRFYSYGDAMLVL
ncbi:MAG TPA: tRNA preQ1(34) S-adenosylmethionine ribosyltransferase-isomerase QueA [Vicinamibacterales bacterium]|nr:tRNA preQ1(34) S-adenosylmethionine ribosyltransferase-isomerase QueA [Vicinamibacterales bacterium]